MSDVEAIRAGLEQGRAIIHDEYDGTSMLNTNIEPVDLALSALRSLESQNQALQERAERAERERDQAIEAVASDRAHEALALVGQRDQAQERAEKAEARSEQLEGLQFQYLGEKEHWMTRAQHAESALRVLLDDTHDCGKTEALQEAVSWVLEDAAYKAPEQIGDVAGRWVARLADALSPTQETDPE